MTEDIGASAAQTGLSSSTAPEVAALRASIPDAAWLPGMAPSEAELWAIQRETQIRDAVIDEVARWVEEASFREIQGICARRKRDRENAALRALTIREERVALADMIRGRKASRYDDPIDTLRRIEGGSFGHRRGVSTSDLQDALLLAQRGLVTIEVRAVVAGGWNCATPETEWHVTLTEDGRAAISAQGIAAQSDETAQQAQPVGQEPGPEDAP